MAIKILPNQEFGRRQIRDAIVGIRLRDSAFQSRILAVVARWGLVTIDPATFGYLNDPDGDSQCSITATDTTLTSVNDVWTAADVGRVIHVQGAGAAGATLVTTIASYTAPDEIELADAAATTVTQSFTSTAGLAVWGDAPNIEIPENGQVELDAAGNTINKGSANLSDVSTSKVIAAGGTTERSLSARFADECNAKDYGATGDGVTNDTAALVAWAAAGQASGKRLRLPAGRYVLAGRLNIDTDLTQIVGDGMARSVILWSGVNAAPYSMGTGLVYGQTGKAALLVTGDQVGLRDFSVIGPSTAAYVINERGIVIGGASAAALNLGFNCRNVEVGNMGSAGILPVFCGRFSIENNYVHDIGYEAISLVSCVNGDIDANHVEAITPGTSGNMYGISLSHDTSLWPGDQATSPFTTDVRVTRNYVKNVNWEGIGCHGGFRIQIALNDCRDCQVGITAPNSSGTAAAYAGGDHTITANFCDAGIYKGGAVCQGINVSGGSTVLNRNVTVTHNTLVNYGLPDNANGAVISAQYLTNGIIEGNIIKEWRGVGVLLAGVGSSSISVKGNHFSGTRAVDTVGYCIYLNADLANISILDNRHDVLGGTAAVYGVRCSANTQPNPVTMSGNDFSSCSTGPFLGTYFRGSDRLPSLTAADGDLTPSVKLLGMTGRVIFNYTAPASVTNLDDAVEGQIVVLYNAGANNITFTRANASLGGSANWVGTQYDTLTLMKVDAQWVELARSANG